MSAEDVAQARTLHIYAEVVGAPYPAKPEIEHVLALAARLQEAERERDNATRALSIFFALLPTVIGCFFDDAHNAWVDGREHEWDQTRFESEVRKAIYDETRQEIPDPVALIARAEAAEAREAALREALTENEKDTALLGGLLQSMESPQGSLVGAILKRTRAALATDPESEDAPE
jgi:hypothetical protein